MGTIPCSMFYVILVLKPPHLSFSFVCLSSLFLFFLPSSMTLDVLYFSCTLLRFLSRYDMQISFLDIKRPYDGNLCFVFVRHGDIDEKKDWRMNYGPVGGWSWMMS